MADGMTNEVVNGVIAAIKTAFPLIPVYDNPVDQGLEEPSFSVRCVRPAHILFRGKRYHKTHLMEIVYFPTKTDRYTNSNDVAEQLFIHLEWINAGNDLLRGENMEANYSNDKTLVFTVTYDYFVIKTDDQTMMDELEQNEVKPNEGQTGTDPGFDW